jgi:hypothetical protein
MARAPASCSSDEELDRHNQLDGLAPHIVGRLRQGLCATRQRDRLGVKRAEAELRSSRDDKTRPSRSITKRM